MCSGLVTGVSQWGRLEVMLLESGIYAGGSCSKGRSMLVPVDRVTSVRHGQGARTAFQVGASCRQDACGAGKDGVAE